MLPGSGSGTTTPGLAPDGTVTDWLALPADYQWTDDNVQQYIADHTNSDGVVEIDLDGVRAHDEPLPKDR